MSRAGEDEKALRGILSATSGITDQKHIPNVADSFKPFLQPVGAAMEAA